MINAENSESGIPLLTTTRLENNLLINMFACSQ